MFGGILASPKGEFLPPKHKGTKRQKAGQRVDRNAPGGLFLGALVVKTSPSRTLPSTTPHLLPFVFFLGITPVGQLAEEVGFEPTDPCGSPVFKTGAIDHSATPPLGG